MSSRRKSKMPEANKMARSIRNGSTTGDLALRYGVNSHVITRQLINSGWDPITGDWVGSNRRPTGAPLALRGGGPGATCHHVGGGDNPNVVPLVARPFKERVRPKFAWPDPPADSAPPPAPVPIRPKPPLVPGKRAGLTDEQRQEIAERYRNGEGSTYLAVAYGINDRTVRAVLRWMDVPLRSRSEATKLRWNQGRMRAAESGWTDPDDNPKEAG